MIKVIVDSTSCISKEYADKHDIKVVNLTTTINDFSILEGYEDNWGEFYEKLKHSKDFPKTSQPTPEEFINAYKDIISKDNNAEIIVVTLSQELSGTFNSARLAKEQLKNENIYIIDSGQTAQSQLLLVEDIVDMINNNKTSSEILEEVERLKKNLAIHFVPQTMEYLKRGGRITLLSATIASVLNIKPILSFKNGKLTNSKKCLGMGKAISELVAEIPSMVRKIYVCYIHESEWVGKLLDKVSERFNFVVKQVKNIGPVVGSHIGIGAVGLAYIC